MWAMYLSVELKTYKFCNLNNVMDSRWQTKKKNISQQDTLKFFLDTNLYGGVSTKCNLIHG